MTGPSSHLLTALLLGILGAAPLNGIVFYATGDPAHNLESAPHGAWAGAGWQYQGCYRIFTGTMISPRHFLTARHFGAGGDTFVHKAVSSGEPGDRTYYINPNANAGAGYWNIPGTDFRVFEVYGEFPGYALLYTGADEVGRDAVMMGRGRTRGEEFTHNLTLRGWRWGASDRGLRWGTNRITEATTSAGGADLLATEFDPAPGTDECHASPGDSGGGLFVRDGATWKLAGILFAVDGPYDTNNVCGDGTEFEAALFDATGLYAGGDSPECDGWELVLPLGEGRRSRTYASRVSSSAAEISAIIQPAIDDAAKSPLQRYEDWISTRVPGGSTAPTQDADADGEANLVEYLANLDPAGRDGGVRSFEVSEVAGKVRFKVRRRLDAEARGLSAAIQHTRVLDPPDYTPVSGLSVVAVQRSLAEGVETIEYEADKAPGARCFFRLQVSLAP